MAITALLEKRIRDRQRETSSAQLAYQGCASWMRDHCTELDCRTQSHERGDIDQNCACSEWSAGVESSAVRMGQLSAIATQLRPECLAR